uniref:Ubiquitin-like domain-containing protein n=1 Tax=Ditylenchus dipsaci TaxID=166011 RepID=A0A915E9W8_9BILA
MEAYFYPLLTPIFQSLFSFIPIWKRGFYLSKGYKTTSNYFNPFIFKFPASLRLDFIVASRFTVPLTQVKNVEEVVKQSVQLTIRCAMQSFEDRNVECPLDWTVLELKQHLFSTFPTKPEVPRQRLIYAGHCLDNAKSLRSILQARGDAGITSEESQVQVIHLVCASKDAFMSSSSSNDVRFRPNAATHLNNLAPSPHARNGPVDQPAPNPFQTNGSQPQFNQQVPPQMYEAYAASYQNYLNQMNAMMQQQQLYLQQNAVAGQPNNFAFGAAALGALHPAQQFLMAGPMGAMMQQQQNAVNAAARAPAAGVIQADAENRQPDLLDLAYKSIRFALLMMVLYLYSSIERFFFVLLVICGIWFVQMRRERRNRNGANQQQQQPRNQPVNDNNNNNELTPDRAQREANGGDAPAGAANTIVEENQMNAWTVFWSTVSSFSLL